MSFQKRLTAGDFVVLAELNTPKGVDIHKFVHDARRIRNRVDGVVVPDMDCGVMRMSALAGGVLVRDQGLEPVIHVYGRDRNRMALQGDLLAAHVLGVRNLLVSEGVDLTDSDHRDAYPVDDLDALGIFGAVCALQEGRDLAGFELDGCPEFFPGCTLPPCADDGEIERELERLRPRIDAGARFVIAPPVFDIDRFAGFMERAAGLGVPVIPSVFLLKSVAVARYISTHEPGAHLPESLIQRIRRAEDREREGIRIAGETAAALKTLAPGVLIQAMGWEHALVDILDIGGL